MCPAGGHHDGGLPTLRAGSAAPRLLPLQRFRAPGSCGRRARRPPGGAAGAGEPRTGALPDGAPRESAGAGRCGRCPGRRVFRGAAGRAAAWWNIAPGGGGGGGRRWLAPAPLVDSGFFFNILLYFSTDSSQSLAPVLVGPAGQAAAAEGRGLPSWWAGGERHRTAHGELPPPKV